MYMLSNKKISSNLSHFSHFLCASLIICLRILQNDLMVALFNSLNPLFFLQPKMIVTASFGIEPGRRVEYIPLVEKALQLSSHQPSKVLIYNRPNMVSEERRQQQQQLIES